MSTHSRIPAWEISWTEEPEGLQSMGPQGVRHNWATEHTHTYHYITIYVHYIWHIQICQYTAYTIYATVNGILLYIPYVAYTIWPYTIHGNFEYKMPGTEVVK